jgi:ADP-ribose diphosphatase
MKHDTVFSSPTRPPRRPSSRKPRILSVNTAARSRYFHIESVHLKFRNGSERHFERIAGSPNIATVLVVAMASASSVLLVKEYAVGLDRYDVTLPMGCIEEGETAEEAANRELKEETGFGARTLRRLCTLTVAPTIFGYRADVVLATDLYECEATGDEPERPECTAWELDQIAAAVVRQEICEARTLAALFVARSVL